MLANEFIRSLVLSINENIKLNFIKMLLQILSFSSLIYNTIKHTKLYDNIQDAQALPFTECFIVSK